MAWILFAAMAVVAVAGLIYPLARRRDAAASVDPLARPLGERARLALGLGVGAAVAVLGAGIYLLVGRPDLARVWAAPPPAAAGGQSQPDLASLVPRLEAKMKASPGDPRGWRLLGWSYMRLGRYAEAADAYGRAGGLDPTSPEYPSARGEALAQAAGGQVTPAAREAFRAALARDGDDPRARYYLAMARDQDGDHAGAMADWVALIRSAPPGAPWLPDVRALVTKIARQRGEDITARLPPASAEQAGAIEALPKAAQRATIAAMVDRLAAKLAADPRDADGWVALMRARMVQGDPRAANGAYRAALTAFADSPADKAALRDAARALAVPGA